MRYKLQQVGVTKKAVGFDGGIRLDIEEQYIEDIEKARAIWIPKGYETIPFFLKSFDDNATAHFEELTNREMVSQLAGKPVYILESDLNHSNPQDTPVVFEELIGLELYNGSQKVGEILRIEEYPQQTMLVVDYKEQERLIPIHEDLIQSYDPESRLTMELPDGLLYI